MVLDRDLLKPEVSDQEINAIQRVATPNVVFYLGVIVVAIIGVMLCAAISCRRPWQHRHRTMARSLRDSTVNTTSQSPAPAIRPTE